jgi:hypothetical protein
VVRHIFQACPVWIYTQSNITSIIKRKIINEEYSSVATQVLHSLLIIFLLSYVFLRMPIRSTIKGDSFSSAHTWRKCSFVTEIIQHVEYSVPMARVAEFAHNATAHWGNLLTPTITSDTQLS